MWKIWHLYLVLCFSCPVFLPRFLPFSCPYASTYLWYQLPSLFRQPHFVHSLPGSPHPTHITSSQSSPSLSSPIIPSVPRPFTPDLKLISFVAARSVGETVVRRLTTRGRFIAVVSTVVQTVTPDRQMDTVVRRGALDVHVTHRTTADVPSTAQSCTHTDRDADPTRPDPTSEMEPGLRRSKCSGRVKDMMWTRFHLLLTSTNVQHRNIVATPCMQECADTSR